MAASRQTGPLVMFLVSFLMLAALISAPFVVQHYKQWEAQSFQATPGRILNTFSMARVRGDRFVERLDLHYEYFVDGKRFENTTLRFDVFPEMPSLVHSVAKRYPIGSEVTVFHRPGIPSDSLLEPGIDWVKLQIELLFWLCLLGFAIALISIVMESAIHPPMFLQPITVGRVVTVHVESRWGSLGMASLSLAVLSFCGGIVVAVTWTDAKWLAIPIWLAVLVLPPFFYRAFRENWEQGVYDLTIDFEKGTITLPGATLTPRKTLKIADLRRIVVRPAQQRNPTQHLIVTQFEYPILWISGGEDGKAFDDWLAGQLGIPVVVEEPNQSNSQSRLARNSRT